MQRQAFAALLLLSFASMGAPSPGSEWKAGAARVNITPHGSMWLSGYAGRNKPAEGKLHDLWAKALAVEDAEGRRAVLVTMDLVGIGRRLSQEVCGQIERQLKLPRAAIVLAASHTHTGPVVAGNLEPMYEFDAHQRKMVDDYTAQLSKDLVAVAVQAAEDLQPAELSWGVGTAGFAVNRRNNPEGQVVQRRKKGELAGPVDHDVPVLVVRGIDGRLRALAAGYACHATVLNDYRYSGDWPGAAQIELERRHPGALVLYWAGCGGDQNPLPRRSVALATRYGQEFADAVDAVVAAPLKPIAPALAMKYNEIPLAFGVLPTRAELQSQTSDPATAGRWARHMLATLHRAGSLPTTYPYPIQVWRLGDDLAWLFLGGEAVVDYSLELKLEHGQDRTWVASYSNDVMGYIPTRRVLDEGGYEGAEARFPYGLPARWSRRVEEQILAAVRQLVAETPSGLPSKR
jgi:hypothetical protein